MWYRDAVFFLSDRDGVMNLYRYDPASRAIRQLTHYRDYDIKWPSLANDGSGRIVYENGGALYLYDIARETAARVPVRVRVRTVDHQHLRPEDRGTLIVVIREYAGSGGDSVADYFRKYALGPIVGKRTWGGLMGIGNELPMIDGGRVTVPNVSAWDVVDGRSTWIVENYGVDPDVEVDNRPDLVIAGRDPQLERGIAILNEELAKHPPVQPTRPSYGGTR